MAEVMEEFVLEEEGEINNDSLSAKTLANRKKKMKKKERTKSEVERLGSAELPEDAISDDESTLAGSSQASPNPRPASSPSGTPAGTPHLGAVDFVPPSRKGSACGKERRESAVAKAARERIEQVRKLEQERLEAEAERERQAAEEERQQKEAEAVAEAERHQKLEAKHAKVASAKAKGTYMTKAQKEKAAKAALAREQFRSPVASPAAKPVSSPPNKPSRKSSTDADQLPGLKMPQADIGMSGLDDEETPATHRSPIVCVMGHVDTGKTKLLDKLRSTNIQAREAGGITQQIGATFFPASAMRQQTKIAKSEFDISVPGLLMIDTPGHEAFNNLRFRGSSLCDLAVVVVDIMHGLEFQTVESLEMLRKLGCPYIIALNKIDVLYQWAATQNGSSREGVQKQEEFVKEQFMKRVERISMELQERGLNTSLYWENDDPDSVISMVPTSAMTGEGIPDLLYTLLHRAHTAMSEQLKLKDDLRCTVIEVKETQGMGTTIDVLLVSGTLREGDQIVLAGMDGPIVTTIRALCTPPPMKEIRVKGEFVHHSSISTAMGVKISAAGLEKAVCGSDVFVVKDGSCISELQENIQANFKSILAGFERQAAGVYVKASTIGSLEALLGFLAQVKIPVSDMSIGDVSKKDVTQAAIMKERKVPEYAVILAFDVKVNADAKKETKNSGVRIFTADIIYHLCDQFKAHLEKTGASKKPQHPAIFPAHLFVAKHSTVHRGEASLVWVEVLAGELRLDTPICFPQGEEIINLGYVVEILKHKRPTDLAYPGDKVCMKLHQTDKTRELADEELTREDQLCSLLTRESNETLMESCRDELRRHDWACLDMLKKTLKLD